MCAGSAPNLAEADIHVWSDGALSDALVDRDDESQVCVLLDPRLQRYDFPGYKKFDDDSWDSDQ